LREIFFLEKIKGNFKEFLWERARIVFALKRASPLINTKYGECSVVGWYSLSPQPSALRTLSALSAAY